MAAGRRSCAPGWFGGSFGALRAGENFSGSEGPLAYNVDFTHFSIDGFREHSSAKNDSFNSKVGYTLNDTSHLTLVTNIVDRPDAMDPLGITQAEFNADPESTNPAAGQFNTRKSLQQQQGGVIYDLDITDAQALHVMGYLGHRIVEQYLSIPVSAQAAAGSSGGVVDLNRNFGGADARWSWQGTLAGQPIHLGHGGFLRSSRMSFVAATTTSLATFSACKGPCAGMRTTSSTTSTSMHRGRGSSRRCGR